MHKIAVEIDHSRLLAVTELNRGSRGEVDLTTIAVNQRRALVCVFRVHEHRKHLLDTLEIDELTRFGQPRPTIHLRTAVSRFGKLVVVVLVEGRVVLRRRIDVRQWLPARPFPWLAAAAALLLVGGLAAALLPRVMAPAAAVREPPRVTPVPPARDPAAPAPVASAITEQQWTVYFSPDSAELNATARRELEQIAAQIEAYPAGSFVMEIGGHCAPAGFERGRLQLSRDRAQAVARYLQDAGSPAADEIAGYSSDRPLTEQRDLLHLNRRVEISIAPRLP